MSSSTTDKSWTEFSKSVNGKISQTKANRFKVDNIFRIDTDQTSVEFVWGDQPEPGKAPIVNIQSVFRFKLSGNVSSSLRVVPRDTLMTLLSIFKPGKQKARDQYLDQKYLFFSDDKSVVSKIVPALASFSNDNKFKSFSIETEKENGENILTIQVNNLLITTPDLELFYNLGLEIKNCLQ